jgi:hypothetical protein
MIPAPGQRGFNAPLKKSFAGILLPKREQADANA